VAAADAPPPAIATAEIEQIAPPAGGDISAPGSEASTDAAAPIDAAAAPVVDEIEIEVWWPKDTGPFRARAERQMRHAGHRRAAPMPSDGTSGPPSEAAPGDPGRPPRQGKGPRRGNRTRDEDGPADRKPRREGGKPPAAERKPAPEKPIDPDSPFAVLGALKAKLAGS
jgi:ATP-dependent RNA helicase SUPV3L1/SUV3